MCGWHQIPVHTTAAGAQSSMFTPATCNDFSSGLCEFPQYTLLNSEFSHTNITVDHTRVILDDADPTVVGSDYINASYLSGEVPGSEKRYIATQSCLPETVHKFWRMIWQEDTRVIVMISNEVESGRVSPC